MQINKRDMDLLYTLNKVGYMSSKQINRVFFNSYRYCMRRLQSLEKEDYIKSSQLLYNGQKVIWLYKEGASIIDNDMIVKRGMSALIPHYLSCGEFYFAIHNKVEVNQFNTEFNVDFTYDGKKINFRPDIHLEVEKHGDYLVEIDNKEQKYLIAQKVKVYESFAYSKEYKKYFNQYPPVLIISNAAERFKQKIEEVKTLPMNYYLTEFDNLENIDKAIWLKTGKKERCRLWD